MKNKMKGLISLFTAAIIWGSAFIAQTVGMDHVGPLTFLGVRGLLGVIGLMPLIFAIDCMHRQGNRFFKNWKRKGLWKAGFFCSIPLGVAMALQQCSLADTDAGKAAFLTALYIIIVPILGMILRVKPSKMIPYSVVLAVAGLYLLSIKGAASFAKSDVLLLLCALSFSVQIMIINHYGVRVDPFRLNAIQFFFSGVVCLICGLIFEHPTLKGVCDAAVPLMYAGFLSGGLAYSLQIVGQKYLEPSLASIIMSMESVFAALFGWLLLRQTMNKWELLGCVLMFAAVSIAQIPDKRVMK